jgi:hypothetical protein
MNIARKIVYSIFLGWLAAGLSGCDDTPTSDTPAAETGKPSEKPGPSISLSVVQSSPYATSYSLKGTVGKSGSVSVYPPTLTLDGIDRSSDFTFPSSISKMVDAPYDLSGIYFSAKSGARPGDYLLTVTASDSLGTSRATCTLSVRYKPLEASSMSASVFPGGTMSLSGSTHFPEDYATLSFQVVPQENSIILPATIQVTNGPWSSTTVATSTSTPLGNYRVVASLKRSNGILDTVSVPLTVVEATTRLDDNGGRNTLTLGAQAASAGSFLNVDGYEAFLPDSPSNGYKTSAQKKSIDVVFFASEAGVPTFYAPTAAASAGLGGIASWGSYANSTIIVDVGTSSITTKEGAIAAIGSQTSAQAAVFTGHCYALKLSNGNYAVLQAILSGGSNTTATVTVDILSE